MSTAMTALSAAERILKADVERRIRECVEDGRRAFYTIGECLDTIIERRLYRDEYPSLEAYCEAVWGFSGSVGRKAANTFRVAQSLQDAERHAPDVYWDLLTGLKPGHAAVLSQLPEEARPVVWREARQETTEPTVSTVEAVVARYRDRIADLPNMTAGEESAFNQEVEAAVGSARQMSTVRELARLSAKRVRSVCRGVDGDCRERFAKVIDLLQKAAEECDALAT